MMPEKKVLQLMRAVAPRRSSLVAESYALVKGGAVYVNDCKCGLRLAVETDAPDGVVNIALAVKAGRFDGAYVKNFDAAECVVFPRLGDSARDLNAGLFGARGLLSLDFAGYCKIDPDMRGALTGVFIGRGSVCATDGHRLLTRPASTPEGLEIVVPADAVNILKKLPPVESAVLHFDSVTPENRSLRLSGAGYVFDAELLAHDYPAFEKIIPKEFNCVAELSAAEVAELKAGVEILLPYTAKSRLICFDGERATVRNDCNGAYVGAAVPAVSAKRAAFNGGYLADILDVFPGGVNICTNVATAERYEKDKAAYEKALPELEKLRTEAEAAEAEYDRLEAEKGDLRNIDDIDDRRRALEHIEPAVGAAWNKFAAAGNAYKELRANCKEPTPPEEANKVCMISAAVFSAGDVTALLMPLKVLDDEYFSCETEPETVGVKPTAAKRPKPKTDAPAPNRAETVPHARVAATGFLMMKLSAEYANRGRGTAMSAVGDVLRVFESTLREVGEMSDADFAKLEAEVRRAAAVGD